MKTLRFLVISTIPLLILSCTQDWDEIVVSSPDYKLQLIFNLENGVPSYKLNRNGKHLILESHMGFKLNNLPSLDSNFILLDKTIRSFDEVWEQPWGEVKEIRNNYNELKVFLREAQDSERKLHIVFRIFNDGLGFRYEFPEQEFLDKFQITEEKTQFVLPSEEKVWWIPAYMPERYEYLYQKTELS